MTARLWAVVVAACGLTVTSLHSRAVQQSSGADTSFNIVLQDRPGVFFTAVNPDDLEVSVASQRLPVLSVENVPPANVMLAVDVSFQATFRMFSTDVTVQRPRGFQALPGILERSFIKQHPVESRVCIAVLGRTFLPLSEFTTDHAAIVSAARNVAAIDVGERLGPSPLWDMVADAIDSFPKDGASRALVLVTDGHVTQSTLTSLAVAERAADQGVAVHVISTAFDLEYRQADGGAEFAKPNTALRQLANLTGGAFIHQGEPRIYRGRVEAEGPNADVNRANNARWDDIGEPLAKIQALLRATLRVRVQGGGDGLERQPLAVRTRNRPSTVLAPQWLPLHGDAK